MVIRALLDSDHKVAMLTGDALLTSLHVAKQVGICSDGATLSGVGVGNDTTGSSSLRLPLTLVGVEAGVVCPLAVYSAGNNTATATGTVGVVFR